MANNIGLASQPAIHGAAIAPSDVSALANQTRGIYVGGGGDVTLELVGDNATILFKAVPTGTLLPVAASAVKATGTTATNLLALW